MAAGRSPARKTYSRIASGRRLPSEYEIVSSDLHYNFPRRFELAPGNPVVDWYYRHREASPFRVESWEIFDDPRRTTYQGYNEIQDRKENVVDGLLRQIDESGYDALLPGKWVACLDQWYGPLRYPMHGLQMLAAYVAQLAPASKITNCAAFQAADEMRRLQRVAYRTVQLAAHSPAIDTDRHRDTWENADAFQPLRELIERALATYDWGEAFVVTNVVIKPRFDHLVNEELAGRLAAVNADPILGNIHFSLDEDAAWHRAWTAALLRVAIAETPKNAELVRRWIDAWVPLAAEAVHALAEVAASAPERLDPAEMSARVSARADRETATMLDAI
jgi:toluene monooxygenase system protein E